MFPQWFVDGSAGFGDAVTFGLTDEFRNIYGGNEAVDKCSDAYRNGGYGGTGTQVVIGGGIIGSKSFARGGWTNSNRYLRIGWGRHNGYNIFRISGKWVKTPTGHIDLFRGGRL